MIARREINAHNNIIIRLYNKTLKKIVQKAKQKTSSSTMQNDSTFYNKISAFG
jgi:chaperonin GroEL (HSP60 family)